MSELSNMKNNLIQNFYIIGIEFEEIISYLESTKTLEKSKIFTPKLLSKFPKIDNMNKIMDQFVISHCFPNGLVIKKGKKYKDNFYHFEFELDNKLYQYIDKNKYLYSKIHFTCLKFYEDIKKYVDLNNQIKNEKNLNLNNNEINTKTLSKTYEIYFIPKVICFASLLPFPSELEQILLNIYCLYKTHSEENKTKNQISYSMDKLIEQIIMTLPIPIMNDKDIILSFDNEFFKNTFHYKKVTFSAYNLRDYFLNKSYDFDMSEIFINTVEVTIVNIFRNILLEIPVLFFSEDKKLLSNAIETFLNIISPFKYIHPCVTILPSELYGLILSCKTFIFGINQKYSDFLNDKDIHINKNIFIVSIVKDNNIVQLKAEEIIYNEEYKIKNINLNKNIDLPLKYKKKLLFRLKNYLSSIKNDMKLNKYENKYIFKNKIMNLFQKFFINLLSGYSEYLITSPDNNYFGFNIRHKLRKKYKTLYYIKEIFNYEEFMKNIQKDYQPFYKVFFNTELFYNFIRNIIYPDNEIDSLKNKYFDFLTFLKKEKSKRKSDEFFEQYQKYKMPFTEKKNSNKMNIIISENYFFNDEEKKILNEKRKEALEKYYQLIINKDEIISIKYFLFPKLLFDNDFFNVNYNIQFYRHYMQLPSNSIIKEYNLFIEESEREFLSKCCFIIYSKAYTNQKKDMNISSYTLELYSNDYIELNWLLLSSCSLWYCKTEKEKEIRINQIFDILGKIELIEEQALYFIIYYLYKEGKIPHFIRIYEILLRFKGFYSYHDLLLLYDKLNTQNKDIINNNKNENNNIINKRSLVNIRKYINNIEIEDKIKEKIIFYNKQVCEKCKQSITLNEQEILDIINQKIKKGKNNFIFKCKNNKCNGINFGIKINYEISLINIKKENEKLISKGNFDLIMPHLLYNKIKHYLINLKENRIDIDHIFSNKNMDILNFAFYFSIKSLPFDFLFPYEDNINKNEGREYFVNYNYIKEKEIKKFSSISIVSNNSNLFFHK